MIGRRKERKPLILVAVALCLFFSSSSVSAAAISSTSLRKLGLQTEVAQEQLNNNDVSMRPLIQSYCTSIQKSEAFIEKTFVYNPRESVFVYLLCRNITPDTISPYFQDLEKKYFKRLTFDQLGFTTMINGTNHCNIDTFFNDCDLAVNVPTLLNGIINDYVNMKQPNIYGMTMFPDGDTQKVTQQVDAFSSRYFNGLEVCTSKDPSYPKTCNMMKSYVRNVRNSLNDLTILNASGIFSISAEKSKTINCNVISPNYDVFYCGLYGSQNASLAAFLNLVYNELFYYRIFMGYSISMLQQYPALAPNATISPIIKKFSVQDMRSKQALSLSLRMMRDIYVAFPLHVGFSLYQEDLTALGFSLARLAPPIYTLYDKFRNVQKPQ